MTEGQPQVARVERGGVTPTLVSTLYTGALVSRVEAGVVALTGPGARERHHTGLDPRDQRAGIQRGDERRRDLTRLDARDLWLPFRHPSSIIARGLVRLVEQLDRVAHRGRNTRGGEPGAELHETPRVAGRHHLGSGLGERGELRREYRARHRGFHEGEQSRAATAQCG